LVSLTRNPNESEKLLTFDPDERPSADACLYHKFFRDDHARLKFGNYF
jgi:hypothetical protein